MRPSETDIAWLAGIMDGEGTIALYSRPGTHREYMYAHFGFAGTDMRIVQRGRDILKGICGDESAVRLHAKPRSKANPKWKDAMEVRLEKQQPLHAAMTALTPYLVGKKQNAEIVLEWLSSRLSRPHGVLLSDSERSLLEKSHNVMKFSRSA